MVDVLGLIVSEFLEGDETREKGGKKKSEQRKINGSTCRESAAREVELETMAADGEK